MSAINLYATKQEAFYYRDSQRNRFYEFGGIQLIPDSTYTQSSNVAGLDLLIPTTLTVCRLSDDTVIQTIPYTVQEQSISSTIFADSTVYTVDNTTIKVDSFNIGVTYWTITPTVDCGMDLVYLNFGNGSFYSNPFYITSVDEDLCTKFSYKNLPNQISQSIGLKTWFRQKSRQTELTTYYESSTKNTVTQAIKVHDLELHESEFMSIDDLILTATILESPYLYIGTKKYSLFEAIKIPELTQQENFGKLKFILAPNN